jgi:hypothetical protein
MSFEEAKPSTDADADADADAARTDPPHDDALRCRACKHVITQRSYRTERSGAYEHTFVNPGGFMHTLGCFVAAPGCTYQGDPETAFSWFPGWAWQIAVCARCHAHVGWIFRLAPEQFHGLLIAALE